MVTSRKRKTQSSTTGVAQQTLLTGTTAEPSPKVIKVTEEKVQESEEEVNQYEIRNVHEDDDHDKQEEPMSDLPIVQETEQQEQNKREDTDKTNGLEHNIDKNEIEIKIDSTPKDVCRKSDEDKNLDSSKNLFPSDDAQNEKEEICMVSLPPELNPTVVPESHVASDSAKDVVETKDLSFSTTTSFEKVQDPIKNDAKVKEVKIDVTSKAIAKKSEGSVINETKISVPSQSKSAEAAASIRESTPSSISSSVPTINMKLPLGVPIPGPIPPATSNVVNKSSSSYPTQANVGPSVVTTSSPAAAAVNSNTNNNNDTIIVEKGQVDILYVGRVIGKGGEMIRDLQARSGCRIDVDQNVPAGAPRIITYRGTRKTIDFAKQLISLLCSEQGGGSGKDIDLPLGEAKRRVIPIPASSIGKIIGKSGEMIRELQNKSQAKIQIDHTHTSDSQVRKVTVIGSDISVTKAEEMIHFLIANPLMDAMAALTMLIQDKTLRGGVWGSGPPYTNMPNSGQNMAGRDGTGSAVPPGGAGGDYRPDMPMVGSAGGYNAPPSQGYGGYMGHVMPMAPTHPQVPLQNYAYSTEVEVFPCAKSYMGRVIGQKGVTINDVQKRSGCDIQINQDVPPGHDCEITIKGPRQGIENAKRILMEIIQMGPNHPYAGGGGSTGLVARPGMYQPQQQPQQQQQQQQPLPAYIPYGQVAYGQPAYGQPSFVGGFQGYSQAPYQPYSGYPGTVAPMVMPGVSQPPVYSPWKSALAPDGQTYYYNEKTGATTWDKPPGFQ